MLVLSHLNNDSNLLLHALKADLMQADDWFLRSGMQYMH